MVLVFFKKYILEIVVFICGASLMILQIVGSRILAPWFGSAAFVWANLIGIMLGSLSLGYFLGGKIADKFPKYKILSLIIFFSAVFILIIFSAKSEILALVSLFTESLKLGSFLASLILFSIPSILLGMITPFSLRLKIKDVVSSGRTAGNLFAVSTGGSIFGTFLAGLFLIPVLGIKNIIITISIFLFFSSFLAFLPEKTSKNQKISLLFFSLLSLTFFYFLDIKSPSVFENLIFEKESQYQGIMILDIEKNENIIRYLLLDGFPNSAMYLRNGILIENELVFDYLQCFNVANYYFPNPKRVLMIGGGVYTYPQYYLKKHPETLVDVVEIDPSLIDVAQEFFAFRENPRLSIFHQDGRTFVRNSQKKYDVIFLDAFSGHSVPHQLTTFEFLKDLRRILKPEGMVITNIISSLDLKEGKFTWVQYLTYKSVFEEVKLLAIEDPENLNLIQNILVLAFNSKPSVRGERDEKINYCLEKKIIEKPSLERIPKFTDDFSPSDYYVAIDYLFFRQIVFPRFFEL